MSIKLVSGDGDAFDNKTKVEDQPVLEQVEQPEQPKQPEQSFSEDVTDEPGLSELMKNVKLEEKPIPSEVSRPSREERYAAQVEADSRSIFVGNITSEATPELIEEHFKDCGIIKRITLLYDKNTGAPKGYAYVEFENTEARTRALDYNGSELKGTKINVYNKRTNLPGYHRRFHYQKPNFYYQQQWEYPYEDYQAYRNVNMYSQFDVGGTQGFNSRSGGFRGKNRGNHRGNRRQKQYRNHSNISHHSDPVGCLNASPQDAANAVIEAPKQDGHGSDSHLSVKRAEDATNSTSTI